MPAHCLGRRLRRPFDCQDRVPSRLGSRSASASRLFKAAVRWMFDQGLTVALWSPRHTHRLLPVDDMIGWSFDACAKAEIYRILRETVTRSGRSGIYAPQRDAT
jgi:hypothetical protein